MAKTIETIKEHLAITVVVILLGILSSLSGIVWQEVAYPFLSLILPKMTLKSLSAIISILLLLFLIQAILNIYLYREQSKKPKLKDYEISKKSGFYTHKKTGLRYCPICFAVNILLPLSESSGGYYLTCKKCQQTFDL